MLSVFECEDVFRKTLRRLAKRVGLTSEDGGDESEDSRFIPSRLDFSVRSSHGGGNAEGARELDSINETAQKLDKERRDT